MLTVGVLGANGRMGSEVCRAVEADGELQLVARAGSAADLDALIATKPFVAVDFTTPAAVKVNVESCLAAGIHVVVGTTGLTADDLAEIAAASERGGSNVFVAPNFAIGAVLMMRFAAEAAPHFDSAEIVERHHEGKLDAPSGTSKRTADLMIQARADDRDVPIHSIRLPGSVAHQEVILGRAGETLTIRHDSLDRSSFMPGVVLAIKKVGSAPGLTVGLEKLLDV